MKKYPFFLLVSPPQIVGMLQTWHSMILIEHFLDLRILSLWCKEKAQILYVFVRHFKRKSVEINIFLYSECFVMCSLCTSHSFVQSVPLTVFACCLHSNQDKDHYGVISLFIRLLFIFYYHPYFLNSTWQNGIPISFQAVRMLATMWQEHI